MITIIAQKKRLRQQMRRQRQQFAETLEKDFIAQRVQQHFFALEILRPDSVIAGYWSAGAEVPLLPLLLDLFQQKYSVGLPGVTALDQPLEFRLWTPGSVLSQDLKGIFCPSSQQPILLPTIMCVPLVAFDEQGGRLGQGGGFYDTTIRLLRQTQPLITVGVAYEMQKVPYVPTTGRDEKLDYIVTEKRIYSII